MAPSCNLLSGTILSSTNACQATYRVPRDSLSALRVLGVVDCSPMPQVEVRYEYGMKRAFVMAQSCSLLSGTILSLCQATIGSPETVLSAIHEC
jgi:hypothetical protein